MNSFTIVIPNSKASNYRTVTIIIALLNVIVITYFHHYVAKQKTIDFYFTEVGYIFLLPPLISYFIYKKGRAFSMGSIAFGNFLAAIVWWTISTWYLGLLSMVFSILGFYALKSTFTILINMNGIFYPSFPSKKIQWNELQNAVLKDNILTIDFKNNKLIQHTLIEFDNGGLDEALVNQFLQSKIQK